MTRTSLFSITAVLLILCIPGAAGAQISSAGNGVWSDGSTWIGGQAPDSTDNVFIQAGDTIRVETNFAYCKDLSFGGVEAQIEMHPNSTLNIYGFFTVAADTHRVFDDYWSSINSYIRFAGSADQLLSGWSGTVGSTSFRDVIIDKWGGKVYTDGTDMNLGIQNSLEIVNGTFELSEADDIEGRWATSGNYTHNSLPNVIVHPGGQFNMVDGAGAHHVRAGIDEPIGKFTVFGDAQFRDGSTYEINLAGIDVEDGGRLVVSTGMGGGEFDCDTVLVKSGGEVENYTTADLWGASAVLILEEGGIFDSKTATTIFPAAFTNNGTVRYSRDSTTDQVITDMDYHRLEVSFDPLHPRTWNLSGNRIVADELEVNNSAVLQLTADSPYTLSVGASLRLTSGSIDNSDADVALTLADGSTVNRATGTISNAPVFSGMVNVRYLSSVASVTTGPELPTAAGVIDLLQVWSSDQTVTLGANAQVNGALTLSNGVFDNDGASGTLALTLADGVDIRRGSGSLTAVPIFAGTVNVDYISTLGAVTTGPELPTTPGVLADLAVSGDQGVALGASVTVGDTCTISGSDLVTGSHVLTLGPAATLVEADSTTILGKATTTRTVAQSVPQTFGGIGLEMNAAGAAPGATTVLRVTGTAKSLAGSEGIRRYFDISPANNAGLSATVVIHYDESELNGLPEADLAMYAIQNGGLTWQNLGGSVIVPANTVTASGIGSFETLTLGPSTLVGVESGVTPVATRLLAPFPNPFRAATTLAFELERSGPVTIEVFDVSGRKVRTLQDGRLDADRYSVTWDGVNDAGRRVAPGVYFARMVTVDQILTTRMSVLR